MKGKNMSRRGSGDGAAIAVLAVIGLVLIVFLFWLVPTYNVWRREMSGKAQLAEAEWNRKITIQEAQAKLEAAKSLSDAEVQRAKGVAEANKIIGASLKDNESYLRYLWVNGMNEQDNLSVVYIPTEAGMPIMEAGRFGKVPERPTGK